MALRVLLADESSTIRKVIQLSLQDFNVDVKSVTVGLDVLSVAKTFRPDVVLADVLLAKRSGYEVCHDLKSDPETSQIPVVLMWSGFMEIDEQKARLCGADRRLEKPFDAAALRQIVQEVVTRTQNNPVSSFLQFPPLPPFEEHQQKATGTPVPQPTIPSTLSHSPPSTSQIKMDDDQALIIDDSDNESADEWVQQPINPKAPTQASAPTFPLQTPASKAKEDEFTEFSLSQPGIAKPRPTPSVQQQNQHIPPPRPQVQNPQVSVQPMPRVSDDIVREEIQKWLAKNMPEIAERLIREEINRLLQESEKTIQGP